MCAARTAGPRPEAAVAPLTAEGFREATGVSRETLAHLERYVALLRKWQPAINLVGTRTLADVWRRHMLDSAQLAKLASGGRWIDLGSGAGFPGMVLAIMGVGAVHLAESDQRKAAFLSTVAHETGAKAVIRMGRIEAMRPEIFEVVTARAVAPLADLLRLAQHFVGENTVCLFPKGQDIDAELTEAAKCWKFDHELVPSRTDPRGSIAIVRGAYRERASGHRN
jgi:16S rRNA (guanine527-N7)-methyltransferase